MGPSFTSSLSRDGTVWPLLGYLYFDTIESTHKMGGRSTVGLPMPLANAPSTALPTSASGSSWKCLPKSSLEDSSIPNSKPVYPGAFDVPVGRAGRSAEGQAVRVTARFYVKSASLSRVFPRHNEATHGSQRSRIDESRFFFSYRIVVELRRIKLRSRKNYVPPTRSFSPSDEDKKLVPGWSLPTSSDVLLA